MVPKEDRARERATILVDGMRDDLAGLARNIIIHTT